MDGVTAAIKFPPHVRGWTTWKTQNSVYAGVSPARAGMDRASTIRLTFRLRWGTDTIRVLIHAKGVAW